MSGPVDPATDRVLLAVAAAVLLVVTAGFLLPATIDAPAGSAGSDVDLPAAQDGQPPASDGETSAESSSGDGDGSPGGSSGDAERAPLSVSVEADGDLGAFVPGRSATVRVERDDPVDATVRIDGEPRGSTGPDGELSVVVPGTPSATVTATEGGETVETTVDVVDDLRLALYEPVAPGRTVDLEARAGGYVLRDASVTVAGADAGRTDANGTANVRLPGEADAATVAVSYGELSASETVEFDLQVAVESPPLPLAGVPARLSTRYGEHEAAGVDVYVVPGDRSGDVDDVVSGSDPEEGAAPWLPPASTATVVATDGRRTDVAVLDGLLRNLGIGALAVVSLLGGLTITTLRVLTWIEIQAERPAQQRSPLAALLFALGGALVGTVGAVGGLLARIRLPRLPSVSLPSLSWPGLPRLAVPTLRLPSLGGLSLSLPSIGLPSPSLPDSGGLFASLRGGSDDADDATGTGGGPVDPFAAEPGEDDAAPQLSPREVVRAAVRDLGRLADVRRVETHTPGQIGRRAADRALPDEPVRTIVRAVRDVEYGGREATADQAERVRRAVRRLRDAVADDGDDEPRLGRTDGGSPTDAGGSPEPGAGGGDA